MHNGEVKNNNITPLNETNFISEIEMFLKKCDKNSNSEMSGREEKHIKGFSKTF